MPLVQSNRRPFRDLRRCCCCCLYVALLPLEVMIARHSPRYAMSCTPSRPSVGFWRNRLSLRLKSPDESMSSIDPYIATVVMGLSFYRTTRTTQSAYNSPVRSAYIRYLVFPVEISSDSRRMTRRSIERRGHIPLFYRPNPSSEPR